MLIKAGGRDEGKEREREREKERGRLYIIIGEYNHCCADAQKTCSTKWTIVKNENSVISGHCKTILLSSVEHK